MYRGREFQLLGEDTQKAQEAKDGLAHEGQGSYASWKVLDFFFWKIPGPGKSWKITMVLKVLEIKA